MILAILIIVYREINQLLRMRQKSLYGEEGRIMGEGDVLVHRRQIKASGCASEEAGIFEDWMPNSKINP